MSTSPFEGTDSPYGPADPSVQPTAPPAAPVVSLPPTPPPFATRPSSPGVAALPAYQPQNPLPPRPRNVAGRWALGLGIAGFVFTGFGLLVNVFGSTLAVVALALGILGVAHARRDGSPRASSIWAIGLVAIPVFATFIRVIGMIIESVSQRA